MSLITHKSIIFEKFCFFWRKISSTDFFCLLNYYSMIVTFFFWFHPFTRTFNGEPQNTFETHLWRSEKQWQQQKKTQESRISRFLGTWKNFHSKKLFQKLKNSNVNMKSSSSHTDIGGVCVFFPIWSGYCCCFF